MAYLWIPCRLVHVCVFLRFMLYRKIGELRFRMIQTPLASVDLHSPGRRSVWLSWRATSWAWCCRLEWSSEVRMWRRCSWRWMLKCRRLSLIAWFSYVFDGWLVHRFIGVLVGWSLAFVCWKWQMFAALLIAIFFFSIYSIFMTFLVSASFDQRIQRSLRETHNQNSQMRKRLGVSTSWNLPSRQ